MEQLGPQQKIFIDLVLQFLAKLNIFEEISVVYDEKTHRYRFFAVPHILFKDIVKDISKENYKKVGLSTDLPEESSIVDESVLYEKVFYCCSNLIWGYITGGREIVESEAN
ncbi:MAG: hypothetical protein QXJ06_06155 [Candidatus Aenigmatarchaeota archaeon]